ncbi:hypothetical protein GF373_11455 [bacterium]|nr:hypothetical protein [bacterium]
MAQNLQQIEEEMEEIRMLMKIWNKFYKVLTTAFWNPDEGNMEELDKEFQQIKQVVAEHHGHFMKVIKKDFHIGQSILTTVKRTISLDGFAGLSPLEVNKTLIEWHDANILLNETLGSLECERDKIQRGRQRSHAPKKSGKQKVQELFQSGTVKTVMNLVILLVIIGVLYVFWEPITNSEFYQSYLAEWVDKVLGLFGLEPTKIPVEGQ